MHNHASSDYICPICLGVRGEESDQTLLLQQDIVYKDNLVTVFINSFWIKNNPGHVIVVPNDHYENLYDLHGNMMNKQFADPAKRKKYADKIISKISPTT